MRNPEFEEFESSIGELMRKMRESKKMNRRSVVKALPGLTGAKLRKYERGTAQISLYQMAKIIEHYESDKDRFQLALLEIELRLRESLESKRPCDLERSTSKSDRLRIQTSAMTPARIGETFDENL